jgi:predicted amidohydrolase YtcJ
MKKMGRQKSDMVLYHGKVVTVDEKFSVVEALAIRDGKFQKVGNSSEIRALSDLNTEEIDLKGKTVFPGFIDTHPHVIHAGMGRASYLPLMGLQSIEDIKKRISEKASRMSPGEWIVTTPVGDPPDYFHLPEILKEKRWPTRWDLDEVSPNHPVYITAPLVWAPHPAILNSYALKILGITPKTPSEGKGAIILKDEANGEPNGQLDRMHFWNYGLIFWRLMGIIPKPGLEETLDGLKAAIKDFNANGVTTGYEGHVTTAGDFLLYKELWSRNELDMRICFAYEVDRKKSLSEIEEWMKNLAHATGRGFGDDQLKISGVTVSIDGPSQLGVSVMNKPYLDPYGNETTGVQQIETDKLKEICLLAAKYNIRMNVEVGGDKATDIALEAYEEVNKEINIKDRSWVLQHIQHPSMDHIEKCRELGVAVTTASNFEYSKGEETYVKRLGGDYCERAIPLRRWLDARVLVSQSTDGAHYQPMFTIWNSLKRIDGRTGKSLMTPDKEITREEAIRLYTINGAKVLFWEDKLGSIEEGKLADLVVLENDILTCPLDEIKETSVLMTMVGGKIVHKAS